MRIGIIGAGYIGRALAKHASDAGHEVVISNSRHPSSLASTATATGSKADTAENAARFGEVVFVAVPLNAIEQLPIDALRGKIVVDANNYYPERDGAIAPLDERRTTTSQLVADALPGARLVKAFNAIRYNVLEVGGRPAGARDRIALPIAGNDMEAKRIVADLVDAFGFDPVDAGTLAESWRFERAKPAYCVPLKVEALKAALAAAERDTEVAHGSWRAPFQAPPSMPDEYGPERLADRARIQDLIARACRAVDRFDLESLRDCYHPGAFDKAGLENLADRHADLKTCSHQIGGILVAFTAEDRALVETNITCFQSRTAGSSIDAVVIVGRYVDEIERREAAWKFTRRHVIYDASFPVDPAPAPPEAAKPWETGRRDAADPLFALLREHGVAIR